MTLGKTSGDDVRSLLGRGSLKIYRVDVNNLNRLRHFGIPVSTVCQKENFDSRDFRFRKLSGLEYELET